jgi:hypothetical protein
MPRHIDIMLDAKRRSTQAWGSANLTCDKMTLTIAAAYGGRQQIVIARNSSRSDFLRARDRHHQSQGALIVLSSPPWFLWSNAASALRPQHR